MANPILQAMGAAQGTATPNVQAMSASPNPNVSLPNMPQVNPMFAALMRSGGNPRQAVMSLAQSNPEVAKVMEFANSRPTYKDAFYEMARQKGVDPEQVISMVNGMGF